MRHFSRERRILASVGVVFLALIGNVTLAPSIAAVSEEDFVSRLKAALLIERLNADLLSNESATSTLEQWCKTYGLATPPRLIAERVAGMDKTPTDEQRRLLRVSPSDIVRYRRVRLICGKVVLSEADNWYVPGRLTEEMNAQLDRTNIPFGRVVRDLHFQRHTISVTRLWSDVLPAGWETLLGDRAGRVGPTCIPAHLLEHRAVLTLPDGMPFSEVIETYTSHVLALPELRLTSCAN